ncbi:MAG: hypothetical protein M1482_10115 [Chloroflexi bacterium]|nr:hypothetical protein [Chloroflexota bacterium]
MLIIVRGSGDVGSAVAHGLFCASHAVVLHEDPFPMVTRRGMAFADAVFDGYAELEALRAVRVDDLSGLAQLLAAREAIPVVVNDLAALIAVAAPDVLVDARMRKHVHPEAQRGLARLTIGLGPGFTAGETTDRVVETAWGERLGAVIYRGSSLPLEGEPQPLAGFARERYVYAPREGIFRTAFSIGDRVHARESVASVEIVTLLAPIDGVLRGLTHDGVPVRHGAKVIEVDPRAQPQVTGIGERPRRIAEGVLQAIREADWSLRTSDTRIRTHAEPVARNPDEGKYK